VVSRTSHAGRPVANWLPFERPGLQIVLMKMIGRQEHAAWSGLPQEKRSAAWFDGRNCSLEAPTDSLIYERNTVQNGSFVNMHNFAALTLLNWLSDS
jgi:hypothetical protein